MSRVAKKPIALAKGVELNIQAENVSVKGPKGTLSIAKPAGVEVKVEDGHAAALGQRRRRSSRWPARSAPSSPTWSRASARASSASSSWSASVTVPRCRART